MSARRGWRDVDARSARVVTIGGGTGHYALLRGLKQRLSRIVAVVSMMDSGGSSGRLRDEYGILPPGDYTRCLIALSEHTEALKRLLAHRFATGSLAGHTVRNILYTALEQITGDTCSTVEEIARVFNIRGRVLPVTTDRVDLVMLLEDGRTIRGEANIDAMAGQLTSPVLNVYLAPPARVFPSVVEAIQSTDLVVLGPGDLYTSVVPNLLVEGVRQAIQESSARVIYVCNLMTKANETPDYSVGDFVDAVELYLGAPRLDYVIYNTRRPSPDVLAHYATEHACLVELTDAVKRRPDLTFVGADLATDRALVRHDSDKLARTITGLLRPDGS
ncbi:MAG: YvcK family protein [Chloroflexi bacterium]|nr:YvcK family protein [Chloroflexota bacterium]